MRSRLHSDFINKKKQTKKLSAIQHNQYLIIHRIGQHKTYNEKENHKEEIKNLIQKQNKLSNLQLYLQKTLNKKIDIIEPLKLIRPVPHVQYKSVNFQHLLQPNFPALSYSIQQVILLSKKVMQTTPFAKKLHKNLLHNLILKISQGYKNLPYHNFSHGFSLMLLNYQCIVRQSSLRNLINEEQYLYIMIAGLSHDIGHKGTNNQFQIKCNSQLARLSDNKAVLQNMHIRLLWRLIEDHPECNFMNYSTNPAKTKQIITRLILNTDASLHFGNMGKLKAIKSVMDLNNQQQKWFFLEQMFHACDIGNSTQQFDNYINWAYLITHQFNQQAKLQEQLQIQVTKPFVFTNMKGMYKDQVWFLKEMVYPLWKQIENIMPSLNVYCKNVQDNIEKVKQLSQS